MELHGSSFRRIAVGLAVVVFSAVGSSFAFAQEEAGYINFRVQTVKQDSVERWVSLRKELSDAAKEAGAAFYHVYQRERGPWPVFLIVTAATPIGDPSMDLGEQPQFDVSEHWLDAVRSTLVDQNVVTLRNYPDLATAESDSPHPAENYAHVRIRTPVAGKSAEFEDWLRNDLVPGLREGGAGDVRNARVVLGGNPRTWVTWSFVPGWPEPPVELDPAIIARLDELVANQTDYFYSFREDLSFTAE